MTAPELTDAVPCGHDVLAFWRGPRTKGTHQMDGVYCVRCGKRWRRVAEYVKGHRISSLDAAPERAQAKP